MCDGSGREVRRDNDEIMIVRPGRDVRGGGKRKRGGVGVSRLNQRWEEGRGSVVRMPL